MVFRYMECFHHSECIINIWVPNKNVVYSRQRPKKEKCTAYGRFRILFCLLFIYSTEESLCKWLTCTRPTCTQQTQINMLMTFIHHPAPYCFFADSPYGYLRWGFIGMKSNANQMYSTQQTHCVSIDCGMQFFDRTLHADKQYCTRRNRNQWAFRAVCGTRNIDDLTL